MPIAVYNGKQWQYYWGENVLFGRYAASLYYYLHSFPTNVNVIQWQYGEVIEWTLFRYCTRTENIWFVHYTGMTHSTQHNTQHSSQYTTHNIQHMTHRTHHIPYKHYTPHTPYIHTIHVWDVVYGMWCVGCGVWDVRSGMWSLRCGVWGVECGAWDVVFGVWGVVCGTRYAWCETCMVCVVWPCGA